MSGRAGRRNFDLRGHVIFFGTPKSKVQLLLNSKLGKMSGNIPLTPTLALRMFLRYDFAKNQSSAAAQEVAASISRVIHHSFNVSRRKGESLIIPLQFLFCFEYFLQLGEICHVVREEAAKRAKSGQSTWEDRFEEEAKGVSSLLLPSPTASMMSTFYYLEPANIYLIRLLRCGAIHRLCARHANNEDERNYELLKVLARLWCVLPVSKLQYLSIEKMEKSEYLLRILPPLSGEFDDIAREHNAKAMEVFNSYVVFCAQKHGSLPAADPLPSLPCSVPLPFSPVPPPSSSFGSVSLTSIARSPFSALSGHSDIFTDSNDFVNGVRSGFEMDHALVPVLSTEAANVSSLSFDSFSALILFFSARAHQCICGGFP